MKQNHSPRHHLLRTGEEIEKTPLLPGQSRKPDKTDRLRNQSILQTGRHHRNEGYGPDQPETGQTGRNDVRRNAALRRGRRRQRMPHDPGKSNAGRGGDLLMD